MPEHVDTLVVGSGFGGSVVAYRLAAKGLDVVLLERGRAYPPNSFARTPKEFADNCWDPSHGRYGLFDLWSFGKADAIVSSGLGGGSLIYANVLMRKPAAWFDGWPVTRALLDPHYDEVERMIGAAEYPYAAETPKTVAFRDAAVGLGHPLVPTRLAISFGAGQAEPIVEPPNLHGAPRTTCRLCGECDVGCNYGSKNTLDYTYLSRAEDAGARLRTLCEVKSFEPHQRGYEIHYADHRTGGSVTITARRLVLAAGTFGSTYLLLKNANALKPLGPALGKRFSGNGDFLAFSMRSPKPLEPSKGPVITSTLQVGDAIVQDAGVPAFTLWPFELSGVLWIGLRLAAIFARRLWRRLLGKPPLSEIGSLASQLLGDCRRSNGSLPLLAMGHEPAAGTLSLAGGRLELDWDKAESGDYYDRLHAELKPIGKAIGGTYADSPGYRLLGRLVTVHPVGGCAMSPDIEHGVVGVNGETHGNPGLYVVDGSIMPGAVGVNPSLTIAALANLIADGM